MALLRWKLTNYLVTWLCLVHTTVCLLSVQQQQLVRCITNISATYFRPGNTVLISMPPDMDMEIKTELVTHLHQGNLWSVVILPFEENLDIDNVKIVHSRGSYIIFLSISDINNELKLRFTNTLFSALHLDDRCIATWEPEALFVITILFDRPYSYMDAVVSYVFHVTYAINLSNVVVITNKQALGDSAADYLEVYAHFPYKDRHHCHQHVTEVSQLTLLDTWIMQNGCFTGNINLFPKKYYKNLHGCPIRAIAREHVPFMGLEYNEENLHITRAGGLETLLLKIIVSRMNATLQYHDLMPLIRDQKNKFFIDVSIELMSKKADILIGGLDIRQRFLFEHSKSYHWVVFRWYVPCGIRTSRVERMFKILTNSLWLLTAITMFLVAVALAYVAKKSTAEWLIYKTFGGTTTATLAVILGVSVSAMPRTPAPRVLFIFWVCFGLSFNTVFLMYLTTYMIDPGYEPRIENMNQMMGSGLKPIITEFLERELSTFCSQELYERSILYDEGEGLIWASRYRNVSVLASEGNARHLHQLGYLSDENNVREICGLDEGALSSVQIKLYMFMRNPVLHEMDRIIQEIFEAGLFELWVEVNIYLRCLLYRPDGSKETPMQYYPFNLEHLSPPFFLLLIGYGLALLVFFIELLCHRYLLDYISTYLRGRKLFSVTRQFVDKCIQRIGTRFCSSRTKVVVLYHIRGLYERFKHLREDRVSVTPGNKAHQLELTDFDIEDQNIM